MRACQLRGIQGLSVTDRCVAVCRLRCVIGHRLLQISRGQAPKASSAGSGERRWLALELRLVADVGLVRRGVEGFLAPKKTLATITGGHGL